MRVDPPHALGADNRPTRRMPALDLRDGGQPSARPAAPARGVPGRAWLVCTATEPKLLSGDPVSIGRRSSDVDLVLPHDTVSRLHAEVRQEADGSIVIRNRSPNGLTVNGKQVDEEQVLTPGDVIKIGPYVVRVTDQPDATRDAAPTTYFRHDEEASDDELRERLATAKAEVEAQRRQLESEVWRGFATNRDLAESNRKLRELEEELERRGQVLLVKAQALRAQAAEHWNFEVQGWHTYFVSARADATPVWVHNACFRGNPGNFQNTGRLSPSAADRLDEILRGAENPNVRAPSTFENLSTSGRNRRRPLPPRAADGTPITYTEHTINPRAPGQTLDAERFVTGSDGRVYYTTDHYRTFTLIRQPTR